MLQRTELQIVSCESRPETADGGSGRLRERPRDFVRRKGAKGCRSDRCERATRLT